jgi:ACS family tartrate transporter-like MFS transporter
VGGLGLLLSLAAGNRAALAISMFCLAAIGLYGYLPAFWSLPTRFLTGTAAAASIGLINSFGNLGGFAGPYVVGYLSRQTNSFVPGVCYLAVSALVAAGLIFCLRPAHNPGIITESQSSFSGSETSAD